MYGIADELNRWCLVNVADTSQKIPQTQLCKITREGTITHETFTGDDVHFSTKPFEVITVEVHFPALPKKVKTVDFLEGVKKRSWSNHFHCLNVKVKPFDDPELGTEDDMKKRVDVFEIRTLGWAKTSSGQKEPPEHIANPPKKEPIKGKTNITINKTPKTKPQDREAKAQDREGEIL